MLHVEFSNELVKAMQHYGLGTSPVEVTYGNHQAVITVTVPDGRQVQVTVEEVN